MPLLRIQLVPHVGVEGVPVSPVDHIVACVTHDHVVARAAGQRVVVGAAVKHIVADESEDAVVAGIAEEPVIAVAANNSIVVCAAINGVDAHTAVENVVAPVAADDIVAVITDDDVGILTAVQLVRAPASLDRVEPVAAVDNVDTRPANEHVVTGIAVQHTGGGAFDLQLVVPRAAAKFHQRGHTAVDYDSVVARATVAHNPQRPRSGMQETLRGPPVGDLCVGSVGVGVFRDLEGLIAVHAVIAAAPRGVRSHVQQYDTGAVEILLRSYVGGRMRAGVVKAGNDIVEEVNMLLEQRYCSEESQVHTRPDIGLQECR